MSNDVRWDLIRRIRLEIAEGTYATEEKWEAVIDGILSEMAVPDQDEPS